MDYREVPLPDALDGLVKAVWTLDIGAGTDAWVSQEATPDGCVEIIRRTAGRSRWRSEQPGTFIAGVIDAPTTLTMSGDARLMGIRLWPWAWNMLGAPSVPNFLNNWIAAPPESLAALLVADPDRIVSALGEAMAGFVLPSLAPAILQSRSVAEISIRSGLSYRQIQRWFTTEIGIPPRRYVKLLRFQRAFAENQSGTARLPDAGMPRNIRERIGAPAQAVRAQNSFL